MGFLEKVKNMFTEEVEDDDVKVEKIKKDVTKVSIESPNAKDEDDFLVSHEHFAFLVSLLYSVNSQFSSHTEIL